MTSLGSVEMVPPSTKTVQLHEASCLSASTREPIKAAIVQPVGSLETAQGLGPHYSLGQHEDADARFKAFLELVRDENAELAVAPEYFVPCQSFRDVIGDPSVLRRDTLFVLPLESVTREDYAALPQLALDNSIEVEVTRLVQNSGTYVNAVAVLYRGQAEVSLFLQAKTYEARDELHNLAVGEEFFAIEGQNVVFLVLLCSDANYPNFHGAWVSAAAQKPAALIVHSQWNPKPDYVHHWGLWESILNAQDKEKRLIFSANWGAGSKILEEGETKNEIIHPRSRILRGKKLQEKWWYPNRSAAGLQLHYKSIHNTACEVWHLMTRTEHCEVIQIVRPYEIVPREQSSDAKGIVRCQFFTRSEHEPRSFSTGQPTNLQNRFWDCCRECNLEGGDWGYLRDATICELEGMCNACLHSKENIWLNRDVDQRIPTAQLACQQGNACACENSEHLCCQQREDWLQQTAAFVECLNRFRRSEDVDGCRIFPTDKYPLNVVGGNGEPLGWLLNSCGVNAQFLERRIRQILGNLVYSQSQLRLFVVGTTPGAITENGIIDQPNSPGGIHDPGESGQGINQIHHSAVITIMVLEDEGNPA